MNYDHFNNIIKNKLLVTKDDLMAFTKLPQHQKEQLIKLACFKSQLETAKAFEKKTFSNGLLMGKILSELLNEPQEQDIKTLEWLFSFGQLPDIDKSLKNILLYSNQELLDCVFSRCPLSAKKIYTVLHFAITQNKDEIVDWVLERQEKKYIPFEHDMYYYSVYECYRYRNTKAKDFVEKLITYMPQEMTKIKEKMMKIEHSISSNFTICNSHEFQVYFNNLETVALQFKLEKTLKITNEVVDKKFKV